MNKRRYCCVPRALVLAIVVAATAGCASSGGALYQWGSYEQDLFLYYQEPAQRDAIIEREMTFIDKLESQGKTPPPGLYAELGTLLLLSGRADEAIEFYQKEHNAWPESQVMMGAMIENLQERKHAKP